MSEENTTHSTSTVNLFEGFFARLGSHAQIGRLSQSRCQEKLFRGAIVLARTARGLERVELLGPTRFSSLDESNGTIIRTFAPDDNLLWKNLSELATIAAADCERWLVENDCRATLIDVEPLMDGRTLYFHFLGEIDSEIQNHVDRLAEIFERTVAGSDFARLVSEGCGPGCGTEEKSGCSTTGGCATCVVASACRK